MTKITRFKFEIDEQWKVTISCEAKAGWKLERELGSIAAPGKRNFPLPPGGVEELPADEDLPPDKDAWRKVYAGEEVGPLWDVYSNIVRREPDTGVPGDIRVFGRYLFQTLIGKDWPELLAVQAELAGEAMELALGWKASDSDLHRLNWEMMRSPDDFLTAGVPGQEGKSEPVAITRLVKGTESKALPIEPPPKILYVVGSALNDPVIRPGAEILGLLRHLRESGRRVNSRILQRATPEQIKEMMIKFAPDVVHFICHGGIDADDRGYLELELDEQEDEKRRYSEQILQYLQASGSTPTIVVLSACNTATSLGAGQAPAAAAGGVGASGEPVLLGPHETAPLAAELVAGGVPVVIGMAGRVSDLACRLFTRRFGDALVRGTALTLASAQGRQFAFAHGLPPHMSVDWALPTLFMSGKVDADYAPTPRLADLPTSEIDNWVKNYDLERKEDPIFCGRDDLFEAYHQLFSGKPVLMVRGEMDMGKSRLVREFTAKAVQDGHIPIVISADKKTEETARTVEQLLKALSKAIDNAMKHFEINWVDFDALLDLYINKLAMLQKKLDGLQDEPDKQLDLLRVPIEWDSEIRSELVREEAITAKAIFRALEVDLTELIKQAYAQKETIEKVNGRPLVLLDDVHEYHPDFLKGLAEAIGQGGVGADTDNPIPLFMAYSPGGLAGDMLKAVEEKDRTWINNLELVCFPKEHDEDIMAYSRVLLHPFDQKLPGVTDKAYVIDDTADREGIEKWKERMRFGVDGIPGELGSKAFWLPVMEFIEKKVLKEADDDVLLQQMRGD